MRASGHRLVETGQRKLLDDGGGRFSILLFDALSLRDGGPANGLKPSRTELRLWVYSDALCFEGVTNALCLHRLGPC